MVIVLKTFECKTDQTNARFLSSTLKKFAKALNGFDLKKHSNPLSCGL